MQMALPETTFESSGQTIKILGLDEDEYIFRLIKNEQQFYEFDLLDLVRRLPFAPGSFVDVGANLGNHTVFFARIMERYTHAFEVSAKNRTALNANVEANAIDGLVTVHDYGLHSENTLATIVENPENMGQTRVVSFESHDDSAVELKRLDSVISVDERVALIKVDVEGAELDVLRGAEAILDRDHPVCLVEGHPGPRFEELARFFAARLYRPVQILGRSDNWVFIHNDQVDFLLPYIEANKARTQTRSMAAGETRLRNIQSRADQIARSVASIRGELDGVVAQAEANSSQIEHVVARIDEAQWTAGSHYDELRSAIDRASGANAQVRELVTQATTEGHETAELVRRVLSRLERRRSVRRWAKDGVKAVARRLAGNGVSRRLIALVVPRSIRRQAGYRLLGRKRPVHKSIGPPRSGDWSTVEPENPIPAEARYRSVLICPAYPGGKRVYGGEFVKARVDRYRQADHSVLVVEASSINETPSIASLDGTDILRITEEHLPFFIRSLAPRVESFLTHSPSPDTLAALNDSVDPTRQIHWFHGFEVRDYRRLYFNYSTPELAVLRGRLDRINRDRLRAAGDCLSNPKSTKVFVSEFLKAIAEQDTGQIASNAYVIPNFVDGDFFSFSQKTPEQVRRMLLIRSFANRNYANDIAIDAIAILKDRDGFEDLQFTIRGFGAKFQELTGPVAGLVNVDVVEGLLSREEIAALHATHGTFLCPTRFDTQGVSMGEAMASGLVVVTNDVTAVPEYTDAESSILVRPDDPTTYAEALWDLYKHPERVPEMSKRAADRVRQQCGPDQTIERELALLKSVSRSLVRKTAHA